MNVLVVGGAGYIGSHCVRQLSAAGHRPVVLDSLVYGHRQAVAPGITLYTGDLGDEKAVTEILAREKIDVVNIFRRPEFVEEIVDQAIQLKVPAIWMQEDVIHEKAAEKARQAGIFVVMDLCILKEHRARFR